MREISLTQGKIAIVDFADYEHLRDYKWYAYNPTGSKLWYARRTIHFSDGQITQGMHNFILHDTYIDHIDGDGLNNTRVNLRNITPSRNVFNGLYPRREFPRGVTLHSGRYRARITHHGIEEHLGSFPCVELAVNAYKKACMKYFGELPPEYRKDREQWAT